MNIEIIKQLSIIQTAIKNIKFELLKDPKISIIIKLIYYILKISSYIIKLAK